MCEQSLSWLGGFKRHPYNIYASFSRRHTDKIDTGCRDQIGLWRVSLTAARSPSHDLSCVEGRVVMGSRSSNLKSSNSV